MNAERPPCWVSALGGFDDAVRCSTCDAKAFTEFVDCLMMKRVHVQFCSLKRLCGERVRLESHRVQSCSSCRLIMRESARPIGTDILYQCSTKCDIHDLDSATDGEGRHAHFPGSLDERHLGLVPGTAQSSYFMALGLAIVGGVDVTASGEEKGINTIQSRFGSE